MKVYYYGTRKPDLIGLKTNLTSDGKIYMTTNKSYALMYATYKYINLFIDSENGKLKFLNIYPNLFKKMYFNSVGYIYSIEIDENEFYSDANGGERPIADSYYILKDIKFSKKEKVNVYREFMKLKKRGTFEIIENKDIPKEYIEDLRKFYKNKFMHNEMSEEEIKYYNKYLPNLLG